MADAGVVARRSHTVVLAQGLVALGQLLLLGQVVERRRQAVGAVLLRHAAGHPQRILQPRGQRLKALAAEHHAHMAPAAVGQGELVQPVRECQPAQAHIKLVGHGEVRQAQPAGRMLLGKVNLLLGAVLSPPLANPALQRAQHRVSELLRISALQLFEQRHRHQRGRRFEHRHYLRVPHFGQRISPRSPMACDPLRWKLRRRLDSAGACHADARLGSCSFLAVLAPQCLVFIHL